ncbi:hypothetical protein ACFWIB_34955 [Streptomyces sp. NPDC127051]|uniref:hypothetical protein n=1 Tax=Streptomyces sp. NPDC127051 TaxID=3347119 RepID=UPI003669DA13
MPHASADAPIRFDVHPDHHPAVIATTSGPMSDAARSHLHDLGFRSTGPETMVLARIDHEEAYYANAATKQLSRHGFTIEITPALQEEIDTEWSWGNYPFPWCTREEVRDAHRHRAPGHGRPAQPRHRCPPAAGHDNFAAGLRHQARDPRRPLATLGRRLREQVRHRRAAQSGDHEPIRGRGGAVAPRCSASRT